MVKIIKTVTNVRCAASNKTQEKKAAKALGVEVLHEITEPSVFYGREHRYVQVFKTTCQKEMVMDAEDRQFSASLCENFDWEFDPESEERNYNNMSRAAGLIGSNHEEEYYDEFSY